MIHLDLRQMLTQVIILLICHFIDTLLSVQPGNAPPPSALTKSYVIDYNELENMQEIGRGNIH
jgi:hypothetical protein